MNQPQQNMFDDMNNVVEVDEPVNKEKESVSKPGIYHIIFNCSFCDLNFFLQEIKMVLRTKDLLPPTKKDL